MAEANLEDFFAKRDKKKSSKKKFDTAEDLAKVLQDRAKQKKELETGKSNYLAEGRQSPGPGLPIGGDDEWIEAEEKKPDFSNLKIQELVLTSDDEDDPSKEGKENEEGSNEGPWMRKEKTQSKPTEEEKEKETPKEPEEPKENTEGEDKDKPDAAGDSDASSKDGKKEPEGEQPKKYIPPSMRNKQPDASGSAPPAPSSGAAPSLGGGGGSAYVPPSRRGTAATGPSLAPMKQKKGAPTLEDEDSFPSLS